STALYLQRYVQYRKRKIFASKDSSFDNFCDLLLKNKELNMLIPCGQNGATQAMKDYMTANEIKFDEAVVFTTSSADLVHDIDIEKYDLIALFSPNGAKSLHENYPDFKQEEVAFAALGSSVVDALAEYGLTAQITAPTKEFPSITDAMDAYLKEYATRRR
ncbi:MAG: uroporphyrinogen-III synthase, partial [Bacteroidales bacterium]|nr:uroporphyrinogen-III synthase [Bacteroidales bacterium]